MRALAFAAFTRDHASSTSQTLIPPRRTNAIPSATLTVGVNMVFLRQFPFILEDHCAERFIPGARQMHHGACRPKSACLFTTPPLVLHFARE
jgi:hypothetical protein